MLRPPPSPSAATLVAGVIALAPFAASAQDLLAPSAEAPAYQIRDVRVGRDAFGRTILAADYVRLRQGAGEVRLAGRTPAGPLRISSVGSSSKYEKPSGVIELSIAGIGLPGRRVDYELFFVVTPTWAGETFSDMLVSNAVRVGNPGPPSIGRKWNDAEQAAYEKEQRRETPPGDPPTGYVLIGGETLLAAGMPVRAGRYGEWVEAELLSAAEMGRVSIRYTDQSPLAVVPLVGWLAATPETLEAAASEPPSFEPSVRVLPGGTTPLPSNARGVPRDITLPPGTPVLVRWGGDWKVQRVLRDAGYTIAVLDPDKQEFFGNRAPSVDFVSSKWSRGALAIEQATLDKLRYRPKVVRRSRRKPRSRTQRVAATKAKPAERGEEIEKPAPRRQVTLEMRFPIGSPLPEGYAVLPPSVPIEPGTEVAFNDEGEWIDANVVGEEGDQVTIKPSRQEGGLWYSVPREDLILLARRLRTVQRRVASALTDLKKTLRTWTDSTGKHKVEAKFVEVEGDQAVLRTGTGRTIRLPFSRLSRDDQALLRGVRGGDSAPDPSG